MNDYYLVVDNEKLTVSISTYIFNCFHPHGVEKTLSSISYNKGSGFTFREAERIMGRICDVLNRTNWNREKDVYGKPKIIEERGHQLKRKH